METTRHSFFDDKVQLYQRPSSNYWHCSCSFGGKQRRKCTFEESLARAKDVASDWYLGLLGKYRAGTLRDGKLFRDAAERFLDEYTTLNQDQRSPIYIKDHGLRITNHLNPFFGELVLSEITAGKVQDYRIHRMKTGLSRIDQFKKTRSEKEHANAVREAKAAGRRPPPPPPPTDEKHRPPSRSALHQEIVSLRQILKFANRHGWLDHLPNISAPYQASSKVSHRAWFAPDEYKLLYQTTGEYAANPPEAMSDGKVRKRKPSRRLRWAYEQLHDFVLFMGNTGLRPDEALRLEFRDIEIEDDQATKKTILVITVRGKRGVGYCKSMPGAVKPFRRLQNRPRPTRSSDNAEANAAGIANAKSKTVLSAPKPNDLVFPKTHRDLLRDLLKELDLLTDREGNPRTAYSLRHTYISMRLTEGADIYQVAKNCRTSVEMIEKYYASHIKDRLDAAAINVRKRRSG